MIRSQRPTSAQVDRRRLAGKWESPRQSLERVEARPEDLNEIGGDGGALEKSSPSPDGVDLPAAQLPAAQVRTDATISDNDTDNDATERQKEFFKAQKVMKDKELQEREEERVAKLASMTPEERALSEQKEAEEAEHERQKQKALKQMAKSLGGGKKKKKSKNGKKKKKGRMSVASK